MGEFEKNKKSEVKEVKKEAKKVESKEQVLTEVAVQKGEKVKVCDLPCVVKEAYGKTIVLERTDIV